MTAPRKPADRARKQVKAKDPSKAIKLPITGAAGTQTVTVLPIHEWGYAWRHHMGNPQAGIAANYGALIEDILDPADLAKFNSVRPTASQVDGFIVAYAEAVGADLGESGTSQAS